MSEVRPNGCICAYQVNLKDPFGPMWRLVVYGCPVHPLFTFWSNTTKAPDESAIYDEEETTDAS
jgi:hypothetical protein